MNNIIDTEFGGIEYKTQRIVLHSSLSELYDKLPDDIALLEQRYGWDTIQLSPFVSEDVRVNYQCLFYKGALRIIELYVQCNNIPEPNSWDDWSEAIEKQKEEKLLHWLHQCIGTQREFPWGTITCRFDKKSGYTGIWITSME